MYYTKEQFREEWAKDDCKITYEDLADCAKEWGISQMPRCSPMNLIRYQVVKSAGCPDAEEWNPNNEEED